MYSFFIENDLISKHQSGFRSGDSTINQLLAIKHEILHFFEGDFVSRAAFLDISLYRLLTRCDMTGFYSSSSAMVSLVTSTHLYLKGGGGYYLIHMMILEICRPTHPPIPRTFIANPPMYHAIFTFSLSTYAFFMA